MANYEIHIQDVENKEDDLILHYAERDAIELNWLGGDSKTQPIVGSELNFSLEASDASDAAFIELFTLDEKRWLVTMRISESQELVWQGYVLPESYQEPYENAIFYVSVSAVDGLGLLRGVKLPDDFYNDEKSVMQVLCAIIKLTKINLEIFFSPAIVNANEKDWNKLLVDTQLWDKSKDNAYQLLADLLESMRCQIFQCEGRWYIEGFNKRQLLKVSYDVYNVDGTYLRTQEVEKTIKQIPFLRSPEVRMVPGIKEAVVTYERKPVEFPKDFIQENNEAWIVYPGQIDNVWLPKNWNYNNRQALKILGIERNLVYRRIDLIEFDSSKFITTRDKYFVKKNSTVKITMKLKVHLFETIPDNVLTEEMQKDWSNRQIYEVRLNENVLLTNQNTNSQNQAYLDFENGGTAEVELILRPEVGGLLDLKFYEPFGNFVTTRYQGTEFQELSIEVIPEIEDDVYVVENTNLGTNISELNTRFGDDPTLFAGAFYIERKRELVGLSNTNRFWFPVNFYEVKNNITYAIVPLRAAVMASRLRFESFKIFHVNGNLSTTGQILNDPEIIFNYEDGESSAIRVNESLASGHILCNFSEYRKETRSRLDITQWSDAILQVENKRYGQVVGEIEKRIYETPHFSFEGSTDTPIKYNDIIKFNYFGEQRFFTLSKCNWIPDGNTSSIIMNEMLYEGDSSEILPPFVNAGPDIVLSPNQSTAFLNAVASSPSGFIDTVEWTQVVGPTATIDNTQNLQTGVQQLNADFYTFRIKVTDSNGLTAFDEVNVLRASVSSLILEEIEREIDFDFENNLFAKERFVYELKVDPELGVNVSISVLFDVFLDLFSTAQQSFLAVAICEIKKNNVNIFNFSISDTDMSGNDLTENFADAQLSMTNQDTVLIELYTEVESFNAGENEQIAALSRITIKEATVTGESRTINNLPINESASASI